MKFRDDIDPANTWVTSDTHFGHKNIGDLCHSPEDREQIIIAEWRKAVPDDATVLHLGDLVFSNNSFFKNIIAKELTGARKLLILGNHDHQRFSFYKAASFNIVRPFAIKYPSSERLEGPCGSCNGFGVFEVSGDTVMNSGRHTVRCQACNGRGLVTTGPIMHTISFDHYPWNEEVAGPMPPDVTRLHGHIHNIGYTRDAFVPFLAQHVNLSTEQTRFAPVNLKLLLDAVLLGRYPATTEAQLEDARARKEANLKEKAS